MLNTKKNIILLTVECLRADHTHFMGYPKDTTPTLDKLSKLGMCFSKAMVTCPWTPASFKSIFSSRYPLMDGGTLSITNNMENLPEILKEKGYKTCAIVPPGWFRSIFHKDAFDSFYASDRIKRGPRKLINLDKFIEGFKSSPSPPKKKKRNVGIKQDDKLTSSDLISYIENFKQIFPPFANFYTAETCSWIKENQDDTFFLWTHYPDPHETYYSSSPFLSLSSFLKIKRANERSTRNHATRKPGKMDLSKEDIELLINLYDEKVKIVDQAINGVIRKLAELDLLGDTYIIITGDHGQEFMEHGEYGHGLHLYNEVINVPLIIIGPNVRKKTVDTPVNLIDISPTLLDLLDLDQPNDFFGSSLLDTEKRREIASFGRISEEGREKRSDHSLEGGKVKMQIRERKVTLITSTWKYIYREKQEDELYDLRKDPKEKRDLYREKPQIASKLKKRVQKHIKFEKQQSQKWNFRNKIRRVKEKIGCKR